MKNPYNYQLLREKIDELNKGRVRVSDIVKHTGFTEVYIYKILNGEKFYEPAVFQIADFLGVPREALAKKTKRRA